MSRRAGRVTVGVDTNLDVHVAAVVDELGILLGTTSAPVSVRGYQHLVRFAERFGSIDRVGVEGTGAYGAGLARFLATRGLTVVEVDRPNRKTRRSKGKSDPIDAEAAARAVLSGTASGTPKARDGRVEMIRALRVGRRSALRARTQTMNQIRCLIVSGPEELRASLQGLGSRGLVQRVAGFRSQGVHTPRDAVKLALSELGRRHRFLSDQIARLDAELDRLVAEAAPALLELKGVGPDVAGQLLVTAGDNPTRLRSESSFAHLCGVAPVSASSGKTTRHRLNRAGDRGANHALWRIVMVRLSWDDRTKAYMSRRQQDGLRKAEIIRCLKRFVAREVYRCLVDGA